mgnify:CR=1 FL=1
MDDLYRSPLLPWLSPKGPEGDVVISSRVRLARDFDRMPFPDRADTNQLAAVKKTVSALLPAIEKSTGQVFDLVDMDSIPPMEREVLCVKHLASPSLIKQPEHRAVCISDDRCTSIMINEEDHLRIACMEAGLELERSLQRAFQIDDVLEARINMAFDEKLGYLTSWPTNLGTGLRASVVMHLPGLAFTDNISSIINISPQLGLSVNGLYTDGHQVIGNMFRVANRLTLGFTEEEIVSNMRDAVQEIVDQERRARKALELHDRLRLEDRVWRAYGEMRFARRMNSGDALALMSKLRLGVDLGIVDNLSAEFFSELLIVNREDYLKNLAGNEELPKEEIYQLRAEIVREALQRYALPQR